MTKLLDEAVAKVRTLTPEAQDEIARALLEFAGEEATPIPLSPDERDAIERSKAQAVRGAFASEEQVRAVWAKHGL